MKLDTEVSLNVTITLTIEDLAEYLIEGLDDDELLALVKRLDQKIEDWDFTLVLVKYFDEQRAVWDASEDEERDETRNEDDDAGNEGEAPAAAG